MATIITDDELVDAIRIALSARRGYADSRSWPPDRGLEEFGVAEDFVAAASSSEPGAPFSHLKFRMRGDDPPDCEALDVDGHRVAIEITELVDREAVELVAEQRRSDAIQALALGPAEWSAPKLTGMLQERVQKKDFRERLKGGPYHEYIVVIYTAERQLNSKTVGTWLANHRFVSPLGIDRAYLSLDYEPTVGYPLVRLLW
jgi:hypothetical protein